MITFLDLFGIARSLAPQERRTAAAAKWPSEEIQPFTGDAFGDPDDYRQLMGYLDGCLEFKAVRPGAANRTVGLSAEVHITAAALLTPLPLVLSCMPDVAYYLQPTLGVPASLHVTEREDGKVEVAILGLPVEIRLPPGMVRPQRTPDDADNSVTLSDFETTAAPFNAQEPDSLRIVLCDFDSSSVFVRVDVRMTPDFDFVVDTRMPITIGPCVFLDLPCEALHDMQLIPSPRLQRTGDIPVEWARHDLDAAALSSEITGQYTFRAIELDRKAEPVGELLKRIEATRPAPWPNAPPEQNEIEPIIEDIAFPAFMAPVPIPLHFRLGLRKVITDEKAPFGEEYALETAPIDIKIRNWHLKIFRFFIQTVALNSQDDVQTPFELDAVLVAGESPQNSWSFGLDYTDEGILTATAIIPTEDRVKLFKILNREVWIIGFKLGCSLFEPDPRHVANKPAVVVPLGDMGWANRCILLADLEIKDLREKKNFTFKGLGEGDQPAIFHDLGWYLGGLSIGAFYDPDGLKLTVFDKFRVDIQEVSVVSETNGASYLMLSAGVDFGLGKGAGVHLHRLKLGLLDGTENAAPVLLDGLSLNVRTANFELEGFGMISEFFVGATKLNEFAFALRVKFEAFKKSFDLGVGFFYGTASGDQNFTYWMFNLVLGYLPLGSTEARNLRVLVASNMRPRLAPTDGNPEAMRLFRWYKADGDAISLPLNRQLTRWERLDDSLAFGAGARFHLAGTETVGLDAFFFFHKSPVEKGLLVGVEVYLANGKKPVGFGVIEFDFERSSFAGEIGFSLGVENVFGTLDLPNELTGLPALTGTFYFGKNIDYVAVGQYPDPATWFSARLSWHEAWDVDIWLAFCFHYVDEGDGPRVFAASAGAKGSFDLGIGSAKVYGTLTVVVGRFRNEAVASGTIMKAELGLRIRVFGIFNFGIVLEAEIDWLGPPKYKRMSFTFRIETPWWLPDVSVRAEYSSGTPQPEKLGVISTPLISASAIPVTRAPVSIGVTPLVGPTLVETDVYDIDRLRQTGPATVASDAFDMLTPVGADVSVALDFKPSLDAPVAVVPNTLDGVSTQTSGDISVRYELVEIGIRRRRRFGPSTGVWTDLLTPESTRIDGAEDLTAVFSSAVRFEWDVDVVREGKTDTRRLLVNADTAYTLCTYNPEGDDVAATTFPGWPCCDKKRIPYRFHEVDFDEIALGVRVPASQLFTDSRSTLHWQGGLPPVVAPPLHAPAGSVPAFIRMGMRPSGPIAVVSFDARAAFCEIYASRAPDVSILGSASMFVVEAFDGLTLVASRLLAMNAAAPPVIRIDAPKGMTSLLLRKLGSGGGSDVELVRIRYRTSAEDLSILVQRAKCDRADDRVHGSGAIAWLPNCDYEVTTRVRIELDHARSGAQDATVEQKAFFRTKGLPGLNAVARVGDEVEPYVESRYPWPGGVRLYRKEPLAVAFSERFNILVPVNRAPSAAEEANQLLEWVLVVEKVGGSAGFERITQTSEDWVVAHRGAVVPPRGRHPKVLTPEIFTARERRAVTHHPLVARYEAMMTRPGGCANAGDMLHPSQVLVHAPVDPGAPEGATPRWEAGQELCVNLRQKEAPFVDRAEFDERDASAFTPFASGGPAATWQSDGGAMRAEGDVSPAEMQYAAFGGNDWRYVQVQAAVDPSGGEVGIAVAFTGTKSVDAILSSTGQLRLVERNGTAFRTLAAPVMVPNLSGGVTLDVVLYDDRVRATVGDRSIEGALGAVRAGRLALASRGGGRFSRLLVNGLDAWRFSATTSSYDDFPAHIASYGGTLFVLRPGDVGTPSTTVSALTAQTANEIAPLMTDRAEAERRQRLFETWTMGLGLPLRENPRGLSLTRWVEQNQTTLLLLESDEPIPFSRDVTLALSTLKRRQRPPFGRPPHSPFPPLDPVVWVPVATRILTNRDETRALILCDAGSFAPGSYRAGFDIDRARWRAATPDATSNYRASATLTLSWS
jgi:hypothetical protein